MPNRLAVVLVALLLASVSVSSAGVVCDGVDDKLTGANESSYDCTNSTCSLSFWINTTAAALRGVAAKETAGGWLLTLTSAGRLEFGLYNASAVAVADRVMTTAINDGAWHHALLVFTTSTTVNATNTIAWYRDGVLNQNAITHPSSTTFYVANNTAVTLCARATTSFIAATIDDIQFWPSDVSAYAPLLAQSRVRSLGLPVTVTTVIPLTDVAHGATANGVAFSDRAGNSNTFTASSTGMIADVAGAGLMRHRGVE
jgi:Concanavalin A-like lectin/glucanases superfamily